MVSRPAKVAMWPCRVPETQEFWGRELAHSDKQEAFRLINRLRFSLQIPVQKEVNQRYLYRAILDEYHEWTDLRSPLCEL